MHIVVKPGKYIVAVSGGVDSVVLLDLLHKQPEIDIVVAHFNHGIRDRAGHDATFVEQMASSRGLRFELGQGNLGTKASEESARTARYEFLDALTEKHEAEAVITAHHQDDLIETAAINIIRGTGPRGLVSIIKNKKVVRPLLGFSKQEITDYARNNALSWVEDETNADPKYLRNRLRRQLLANMTKDDRAKILRMIEDISRLEDDAAEITDVINQFIFVDRKTIKRNAFIYLPSEVANEIVARWMRDNQISLDSRGIERLAISIKTGKNNTIQDVNAGYRLRLMTDAAYLERRGQ